MFTPLTGHSFLSADDALLAVQANLCHLLNPAYKALVYEEEKKRGANHPEGQRYRVPDDFNHSESEKVCIEAAINYILSLIVRHSKPGFADNIEEQHRLFQRKVEQETFFLHLFIAIQSHKAEKVGPVTDEGTGDEEAITHPFFNDYHLKFKMHEDKKANHFAFRGRKYNEKQLYAAGVYYMIPFILNSIKENNAIHTAQLLARTVHFMDGINYRDYQSMMAGKKSGGKRAKNIEAAYKIFLDEKIYLAEQKSSDTKPKNYLLAEALKKKLPADIEVSINTIRTDWIPKFVKRYERNLGEPPSPNQPPLK